MILKLPLSCNDGLQRLKLINRQYGTEHLQFSVTGHFTLFQNLPVHNYQPASKTAFSISNRSIVNAEGILFAVILIVCFY